MKLSILGNAKLCEQIASRCELPLIDPVAIIRSEPIFAAYLNANSGLLSGGILHRMTYTFVRYLDSYLIANFPCTINHMRYIDTLHSYPFPCLDAIIVAQPADDRLCEHLMRYATIIEHTTIRTTVQAINDLAHAHMPRRPNHQQCHESPEQYLG